MSCQPKINTKTIKKILKVAGILHQSRSCKLAGALVQNSAEQGLRLVRGVIRNVLQSIIWSEHKTRKVIASTLATEEGQKTFNAGRSVCQDLTLRTKSLV